MADKLNVKRTALSLAIVAAILYIACTLLIVIAPDFTIGLFSNLFHGIDITQITDKSISVGGTLLGLVEIIVYALIAGGLFAWAYNKLR